MAIIPSLGQNKIAIETPESKKQKKMFAVLAIVVVAIILVLYFGFGSSDSTTSEEAGVAMPSTGVLPAEDSQVLAGGAVSAKSAIMSLDKTELNFGVLADSAFQALKDFESLADIPGEKGRSNPFLPY